VISSVAGAANTSIAGAMNDSSQSFMRSLLAHTGTRQPAAPGGALPYSAYSALALADPGNPAMAPIPGMLSIAGTDSQAAAPAAAAPRYRAWFEGYASTSRTGPQNAFPGDRRNIYGGVAGFGMTLMPGVNAAVSIDQGRTNISLPVDSQTGRLDLTQFGASLNFESGPWGLAFAGVGGFGSIHSSRVSGASLATASYGSNLWSASTELSYYWSSGAWRLVPKAGFDWTASRIDAFGENGGDLPVTSVEQKTRRLRTFGGTEVGYTTYNGGMMQDVSAYARVAGVLSQSVDPLLLTAESGGAAPRTINGVFDDKVEFDAGIGFTLRVTQMVKLYALYDGAWRKTYDSHTGTVGLEVRW
jgi:uncharacterized protein with beta-barrel porin domain